jgi:hypothetical protein
MAFAAQASVDKMNYGLSQSIAVKRVAVKGKKELYKNSSWDMVDAAEDDKKFAEKVDIKTLPDSMQNKSRQEIKQIINNKSAERTKLQKEIETVNTKREAWLVTERTKRSSGQNSPTLETEIEKIIKLQAKRFNMVIK